MRALIWICLASVLVATAGCAGDRETGEASGSASVSASDAPSASASPSAPATGATRAAVCEEVRAGINAFNAGAFDETVSHFRTAVPLARRSADRDPSQTSRLLLRAVRYYAALPAEDYPAASASSPDFRRWKTVTLGLCVAGDDQLSPVPSPSESGLQA